MCFKDLVVGFGVGLMVGFLIKEIPAVNKATNEMKNTIDKEVVDPMKKFIGDKVEGCSCNEN